MLTPTLYRYTPPPVPVPSLYSPLQGIPSLQGVYRGKGVYTGVYSSYRQLTATLLSLVALSRIPCSLPVQWWYPYWGATPGGTGTTGYDTMMLVDSVGKVYMYIYPVPPPLPAPSLHTRTPSGAAH